MTNQSTQSERLMKFLQASPETQERIGRILNGTADKAHEVVDGPLLLGMSAAAKLLGISRPTLWRLRRAGRLPEVELMPGVRRVRRADLEALAAGKAVVR